MVAMQALGWLQKNKGAQGLENYAIVFMLITSGLRASELCQLRWKNLEYFEGVFTAYFIGKGGTDAEQELSEPAVEACKQYFKKAFRRKPKPDDFLFWTVPSYNGEKIRPLTPHCLWERVKRIGEGAKEQGIIQRNITVTPHTFRRSYATILSKSGMSLKAIQVKTRHANIDTLEKHYIDDSEPARAYLDTAFAGAV